MAYIYTYKFTYIVLAERGVLDDPPNPPGYGPDTVSHLFVLISTSFILELYRDRGREGRDVYPWVVYRLTMLLQL